MGEEFDSEDKEWFTEAVREAGAKGRELGEAIEAAKERARTPDPARMAETVKALQSFGLGATSAAESMRRVMGSYLPRGASTTFSWRPLGHPGDDSIESKPKLPIDVVVQQMKENIRDRSEQQGPDAALKMAGEWLSAITNAVTEVMKEIEDQ
jgi:hypothetical protein